MASPPVKSIIAIAPTTAAATYEITLNDFEVSTAVANALSGAEKITVALMDATGAFTVLKSGGVDKGMTANDNFLTFDAIGRYQISKPATVNPVGVVIYTPDN